MERAALQNTWSTNRLQWAHIMPKNLGHIIGADENNMESKNLQFYIAMDLTNGYETSIGVEWNGDGSTGHILVDYDFLLICCQFCLSLAHRVRECPKCRWRGREPCARRRWRPDPNQTKKYEALEDDDFSRVMHKIREGGQRSLHIVVEWGNNWEWIWKEA